MAIADGPLRDLESAGELPKPIGTLLAVPSLPSPEALERHPHLGEPCPEGWVRVDFHSHTMWSGDSTTTPDELQECVAASGIDVLCVPITTQLEEQSNSRSNFHAG